MSHSAELPGDQGLPASAMALTGPLGLLNRIMGLLNAMIAVAGGLALVASSLVLTHSVVVRYFLKLPTDWQDEASVFLIVGAVFLSAAGVQARRGHVAIEALTSILPAAANRLRLIIVDVLSAAFCAFFSWKSWTLLLEAIHDGQRTTSTWAPPLWVPYSMMTIGMTLLSLQILLQIVGAIMSESKRS